MSIRKILIYLLLTTFTICDFASAYTAVPSFDPSFDPSGAKYKCIVSNVSHPVLKGVYAGYAIRDELWKRTEGEIYFDYRPLSVLGGERDVLRKLETGEDVQGMAVTSISAANMYPRLNLLNLPFLINSFDKLERIVNSGELFEHLMNSMEHRGIMGLDITGWGNYGWATMMPVRNISEAREIKFHIAPNTVSQSLYNAWGFDYDIFASLGHDSVTGYEHSLTMCQLTKKFDTAKYFTQVNHMQGIFIWIFNKSWFDELPGNLQAIFAEVMHDVCLQIRQQTMTEEADAIIKAGESGVTFFELSDDDLDTLKKGANELYEELADGINELYSTDIYHPEDYLNEVKEYMAIPENEDVDNESEGEGGTESKNGNGGGCFIKTISVW